LRGGDARLNSLFFRELQAYPGRLFALDLHLEQAESFENASRMVSERFEGKVDVLINNAGYGLFGSSEDQSLEQIRHQFEVNVFGPMALTRALLPAIRAARGRILCVSSIAGLVSYPLYSAYSASKFALEGWAEGLAYDLRPFGVQVSLVEPGGFKTDFSTRSLVFGETLQSPYSKRTQGLKRFLTQVNPRLGNPMRVAKLLVRLSEKRRIPLRVRVGADAHFMVLLGHVLPLRLRMLLLERVFGLAVFRD
jgi:short-subunit dehydrogenase